MSNQPAISSNNAQRAGTSTLDLALQIIEFLAQQERPISLAAIANTFSASKATVYRHLQTLVRHGFVRRGGEKGSYQAGVKLMVLGEVSRRSFDVVATARDELAVLGKTTGQAACVAAIVDGELVVLDMVQGHSFVEFGTRAGTRLALNGSALGKVWLAFGPKSLADEFWSKPMKAWTPSTITNPSTFKRVVRVAKERGWAIAPNESILGINTIAAPVFNHRSELVAALGVTGSVQFVPAMPQPDLIDAVVSAANRVTQRMRASNGPVGHA